MGIYTAELKDMQARVARRKHVKAMAEELDVQRQTLREKVDALDAAQQKEQMDVDRLEGGSLKAFFYNVVGKMDEKLTKEREEAYQAAVKYRAAARELEAVEYDLRQYRAELKSLEGCEERYAALLADALAAVKAANGAAAEQVLRKEEEIAEAEDYLREIREALDAGDAALVRTGCVMEHLEEAEGYGTWDLLGGGLLADVMKHGELDEAQEEVEQLQIELGRFRTELADVTIEEDLTVNLDGFTRFADWFFDGLFMDLTVMDEIEASKTRIEAVQEQLRRMIERLEGLLAEAQEKKACLEKELGEVLLQA